MTLEIEEAHGKKFLCAINMASNVSKPRTLKKWTVKLKWLEIHDNGMYCQIWTKWQKKIDSCRNYSDALKVATSGKEVQSINLT